MKFIRTFWGDIHHGNYLNQIQCAVNDNLNEIVYVWGTENHRIISELGFECVLVSEKPYDYSISGNHHIYNLNHKNLIHKLVALDKAVVAHKEVVLLDWDCELIKPIDNTFLESLRNGSPIKVPLYLYPKAALSRMREEATIDTKAFFTKLEMFVSKYSYPFGENYVLANTGFVYCRSMYVTKRLLHLAEEEALEAVPDELAVMCFAIDLYYDLESYIYIIEPTVISGKEHSDPSWQQEEEKLNRYIASKKEKTIYFRHV